TLARGLTLADRDPILAVFREKSDPGIPFPVIEELRLPVEEALDFVLHFRRNIGFRKRSARILDGRKAVNRFGPFRRGASLCGCPHRASPAFMYDVQASNMWRMGNSLMPVTDVILSLPRLSCPALRWKLTQSLPAELRPCWQRHQLSRSSALIVVEGEFTS